MISGRTVPLPLVDGSKGPGSYPLAQCDLPLGDLPVIARVPAAQGFLGRKEEEEENRKSHEAMSGHRLEWVVIRIIFMS